MTTRIKNPIKIFVPVFLVLAAMFLLGFGCNTSKPTLDPLAGFHAASKNPDQVIVNDYQSYIQKLSPEDRKYARVSGYNEDGTGQHAAVIEIDLNGTAWNHVLIYDKDNKRIKVVKYVAFHYRS
jgi:hypothetical protein